MEPLAVDLALLRTLDGPELRLTPGRALMARVMRADPGGRGALNIAGAVIEATLPKHVRAGQEIRLIVREVSTDRVVLGLSGDSPPPVAAAPVPLPGGGRLSAGEPDADRTARRGEPDGVHVLDLRYDAPALGPVDLHFRMDSGSLSITVALTPGEPLELARDHAGVLREALAAGADRPVNVSISARREPLDVYA